MIRFLCIALLALIPLPASASPLIADLSNYRIDIDSGFNGTRMFLFGVRNEGGDIIVVVRGPLKDFIVRKKEEIAGIWVNRERMKFWDIPYYYAVASSRPLENIQQDTIFRQLGIGQKNLFNPPADPKVLANFEQFSEAFLEQQYINRLYMSAPESIEFMGETLFKTTIEFPDNIPPGDYTAEIYLVSYGEVVGMQSTPIRVVKTGLDAFLYRYAHESPAFYGITAIVMALAAGWFAGRLFEKA
jgi:uncharacterized protein (TIGR02186 family)